MQTASHTVPCYLSFTPFTYSSLSFCSFSFAFAFLVITSQTTLLPYLLHCLLVFHVCLFLHPLSHNSLTHFHHPCCVSHLSPNMVFTSLAVQTFFSPCCSFSRGTLASTLVLL